jgi:hypothetical protein
MSDRARGRAVYPLARDARDQARHHHLRPNARTRGDRFAGGAPSPPTRLRVPGAPSPRLPRRVRWLRWSWSPRRVAAGAASRPVHMPCTWQPRRRSSRECGSVGGDALLQELVEQHLLPVNARHRQEVTAVLSGGGAPSGRRESVAACPTTGRRRPTRSREACAQAVDMVVTSISSRATARDTGHGLLLLLPVPVRDMLGPSLEPGVADGVSGVPSGVPVAEGDAAAAIVARVRGNLRARGAACGASGRPGDGTGAGEERT